MNKFYRSEDDRFIFGVCGGLAKHTNSDPTIWRLLFVLGAFTIVPVIFLYIITALITTKQ
jgi:phage shock protein PspC (stress-responsive transcriptional regulator)